MFSQACVKNSVHLGGQGGVHGSGGGVHGRAHAWQRGHAWQKGVGG